jgi:PKD repeat protein
MMKNKHNLHTLFSISVGLLTTLAAIAQPSIDWDRTFGGTGFEDLSGGVVTVSDGIVVSGSPQLNAFGNNPADFSYNFHIMKLDFRGSIIWQREYGGDDEDRVRSIIKTTDGGFFLSGFSKSGATGNKTSPNKGQEDIWVIKTNALGQLQWEKTYGGNAKDVAFAAAQMPDGSFTVACQTTTGANGDKTEPLRNIANIEDLWIINIDGNNGNLRWQKTIGGDGNDQVEDMQIAPDGNLLIAGGTFSKPGSGDVSNDPSLGENDFWLIKLNPNNRQIIWDRRYGGSKNDVCNGLVLSRNGLIYLAGYTESTATTGLPNGKNTPFYGGSYDGWLVETDQNGQKLRDWDFGGTGDDNFVAIYEDADQQLVLGGFSNSDSLTGNRIVARKGGFDFWMVGFDQNRTKTWEKMAGGPDGDIMNNFAELPNGEYVFVGTSNSNIGFEKTQNSFGFNDFWIITTKCKTKADLKAISPITGCAGAPAVLEASATNCAFCTFKWDTGATGSRVTLPPGTNRNVIVDALNPYGCVVKDTIEVRLNLPPRTELGRDTTITEGQNLTLSNLLAAGQTGLRYRWSTTDTTATTTVRLAGTYTVTVTNGAGCTSTDQITVTLRPPAPVAAFTAPTVINGCNSATLTLVNTTTGTGTTYEWAFPGGTPATSTATTPPTVQYSISGTYTVTLTARNSTGSTTATTTITVNLGPFPRVELGRDTVIIEGQNLTLNNLLAAGQTGVRYRWSTTDTTVTTTVRLAGTYTVTVTNGAGCTSTDQITITLRPPAPVAAFTAPTVINGCNSATLTLVNTTTGTGTTYEWAFPGGTPATSTATTPPTVQYSTSGTYTVTLTARNSTGSNTATTTITVNLGPFPRVELGRDTAIIEGQNLTLSNLLTAGQMGLRYRWSTTDTTATTMVRLAGTYTVTVTNGAGCTSTDQITITLRPPAPVAAFTAPNAINGCNSATLTLVNTTTGTGTTYEWAFPGGTPATSTATTPPTVQYSTSGTYTVTLTARNSTGSTTATTTITVNLGPFPRVELGRDTAIIEGQNLTLNNLLAAGQTGLRYRWSTTDTTATTTVRLAGTYTVTVTNGAGCTSTDQITITLRPPAPVAAFTAPNAINGCNSATLTLVNTTTGTGTTYEWAFPGGTPATSTATTPPTVQYSTSGTYTVTLTARNSTGSTTATTTITVNLGPFPRVELGRDTTIIEGQNLTLSNLLAAGQTGVRYRWNTTDTTATTTVRLAGTYTITVTNGAGCTSTDQITVTLRPPAPVAAFTAPTVINGCNSATLTLVNTTTGTSTTYEWAFPGGTPATSTATTPPTVQYSTSGTYTVTLTARNSTGSNTATTTITVNLGPFPRVELGRDTAIIEGQNLTLSNLLAAGQTGLRYRWSTTDTTATTTARLAGTYTVTVTNGAGCTSTDQITVRLQPPTPIATFATPDTIQGCDAALLIPNNKTTGNNVTYEWSFPGGTPTTSTDAAPTVQFAASGTYTITLTARNSAGSNTATRTVTVRLFQMPTSTFTFTPLGGGSVQFNSQSQQAQNHIWIFGDGTPPVNLPNPLHRFARTGTFNVTLLVGNPCGAAVFQKKVTP